MKYEMLCGAARTVTDGLKDAQMQYEYAVSARDHGDHETAVRHISEAHKRLGGVSEWMELLDESEDAKTPLCRVLLNHYKHWHKDLMEKVEHFHAQAKA
jgi:hypothetical protein